MVCFERKRRNKLKIDQVFTMNDNDDTQSIQSIESNKMNKIFQNDDLQRAIDPDCINATDCINQLFPNEQSLSVGIGFFFSSNEWSPKNRRKCSLEKSKTRFQKTKRIFSK